MTHETEGEWPKWVTPHKTLIVRRADGQVSVPGFQHHQARDGSVTVLVHTETEAAIASLGLDKHEEAEHGD